MTYWYAGMHVLAGLSLGWKVLVGMGIFFAVGFLLKIAIVLNALEGAKLWTKAAEGAAFSFGLICFGLLCFMGLFLPIGAGGIAGLVAAEYLEARWRRLAAESKRRHPN